MTPAADFLDPFLAAIGSGATPDAVAEDTLPRPFRTLLAHRAGMTGTLAARWGGPLRVQRLRQWEERTADGPTLARLVVLRSATPAGLVTAALAAIRVHLDAVPASVHAGMAGTDTAFGRLLDEAGVEHRAEPLAFLRATADAPLATALETDAGAPLWGRYGRLLGADGRPLCHALELLARA